MLVLNLPFKALMFLTLMRPSLVLFLVLWLKLVKDFRSEERFSRNAETDLVCRLLLEKKKKREELLPFRATTEYGDSDIADGSSWVALGSRALHELDNLV